MAKGDTAPLIHIEPVFLTRSESADFLRLGESTFDKLVARGNIPPPRQASDGRVNWLVDELREWARSRPVSTILPPEGSGHGRAGRPA